MSHPPAPLEIRAAFDIEPQRSAHRRRQDWSEPPFVSCCGINVHIERDQLGRRLRKVIHVDGRSAIHGEVLALNPAVFVEPLLPIRAPKRFGNDTRPNLAAGRRLTRLDPMLSNSVGIRSIGSWSGTAQCYVRDATSSLAA
jgi:hypothetical protein